MPSDGKAKATTKVDLRRLMQQKKQDAAQSKKVDSPLARYSSSGQLSCVVCRTPVKSELAWTAHLVSRSHKERVAALRDQQGGDKRPAPAASAADDRTRAKRLKGDKSVPDDFFEKPQVPKKGILKNAPRPAPKPAVPNRLQPSQAAPAVEKMDTDDAGAVPDTVSPPSTSEQLPDTGQLPEGFFDDPLKDAKARHVEYRDPAEVEWEKFQREMQTQMAESEVILDEDQQEATVGRQIEEVDEQIRNLSRVISMEKRKEQLAQQEAAAAAAAAASRPDDGDDDSSADEAEVDEFLDWRSKGAWK
ncbi:zinc finger protein 830-like [Pollicipes pollicipes]|uniref:zinc finger protein 830-like n=1 Tax=Pollicipes pollicipes TaxID=41117 RepID=UPI001885392F|nr:zinc finger protein 830-like [Pollicipes pollicipes]